MADAEAALAERGLDRGGELEQAEGVGDDGTGAADLLGDLLLRELELFAELRVSERFLDRVEVLALEVLDERELEHLAVGRGAFDDGSLGQPGQLRCAPTAFTGDELVHPADDPDDQRLDDALFADGIGELRQCRGREIFPRLERTRLDPGERHLLHAVRCDRRVRGRICRGDLARERVRRGRGRRPRRAAREQRAQSSSKRRF